jgi:hypothetical protein
VQSIDAETTWKSWLINKVIINFSTNINKTTLDNINFLLVSEKAIRKLFTIIISINVWFHGAKSLFGNIFLLRWSRNFLHLRNAKVSFCVHKSSILGLNLSCFISLNIHFNIIVPPTPRCPKLFVPFFYRPCLLPLTTYHTWFKHPNIISWPITVAARSKAWNAFTRLNVVNVGSNPT